MDIKKGIIAPVLEELRWPKARNNSTIYITRQSATLHRGGLRFACMFGCLSLAALLLISCSGDKKKKDGDGPIPYKTMRVVKTDQTMKSAITAKLRGKEIVDVYPQVTARIAKICFTEGDIVKKGQTLFILDQTAQRAALDKAKAAVESTKAQLATAKLNLESTQQLKSNNVVSDFEVRTKQNAYNNALAALNEAQAAVRSAQNELSYTTVKSPVNGVAGMINYRVGSLVASNSNEPLVTVSDDSFVYAYFSITEKQALDYGKQYGSLQNFIAQAPAVSLRLSNGDIFSEPGKIDAASGIVDENTGAITMRATFPNKNRTLRNGGSATVIMPQVMQKAIVIPQTATYELQNKIFVYKVVGGKTKSQAVTINPANDGNTYIVNEGLQEGDTIVSEGAGLVKEGATVKTGAMVKSDNKVKADNK